MKHTVLMPALGETMDDGSIVCWRKHVGEFVSKGEVLFEVMTDKATFEVEAAHKGYLRAIVAQADDLVAVGKTVAWLTDQADEPFEEEEEEEQEDAAESAEGEPTYSNLAVNPDTADGSPSAKGQAVRVSPRARRLLEQHGIAIAAIVAAVPGRPIDVADVEAFLATSTAGDDAGRLVRLTGMRATIARRMAATAAVPQVTIQAYVIVDRLLELHGRVKEGSSGIGISLTDWIVKAVSITLGSHPEMNAWFGTDGIRQFSHVNMGLAVDTPAGLVVPVIRLADRLSLAEIAEQRVRIRDLALSERLQSQDLDGGTFTVSNLGGYGVQTFTPLLNLPEVGVLGVGGMETIVVVDGSQFKSAQRMAFSLTFDHRAVDGGPAAKFLHEVSELLADPPETWI